MEKLLLLVDDEPAILTSLKRLFHHSGYTVLTANGGYQALDIIRDRPVAIVISDYTMPNLSGAELLSMAKALRPDMYTIVLSGNNDQQSVIRSINQGGASKFVTKPWDDIELLQTVDDAYAQWLSGRCSLDIPGLLDQSSFLQCFGSALSNPYLTDYLLVYLELRGISAIRQVIGVDEERNFINCLTRDVLADSQKDATIGLLDDGKLCVFSPLSEDRDQDPSVLIGSLLEKFPGFIELQGHKFPMRFNVGYTVSNPFCHTTKELMKQALLAANQASVSNDEKSVMFNRTMQIRSTTELAIKNSLHYALDHSEFTLNYQPKIKLSDGTLCGAEALLRWNNPILGNISPADFIPVAEQNGLIVDIGVWVMENAAAQWARWYPEENDGARLSVNVSSVQLANQQFISQLTAVINRSGINPSQFELELTETAMMRDIENTAAVLRDIRSLGVKISIDDFGSGYSSLNYLNRLPIDIMKIDRSFICPMFRQSGGVELVRNMIRLGKDLGIEVVAEGVEQQEQLELLQNLGCDVIQGYYFSKPLSQADFEVYMGQCGGRGADDGVRKIAV